MTDHRSDFGSPTASTTSATASASGGCSQSRTTVQPAWARASSAARSRSTFLASLGDQYHSLLLGLEPCSGQACQKHPSMNTATLRRVNATSGRTRRSGRASRKSLRYRYPRACSAVRSASSGLVSVRRFAFMFAVTPADVGNGYGFAAVPAGSLATLCAISCATRESLVRRPRGGQGSAVLGVYRLKAGEPRPECRWGRVEVDAQAVAAFRGRPAPLDEFPWLSSKHGR